LTQLEHHAETRTDFSTALEMTGYKKSVERFNTPTPRLAAGQFLAEHIPHAALMDSSDGLTDAALKIAKESGLQAILDEGLIPVHSEIRAAFEDSALHVNPLNTILYGGEDFELVAAITSTDWHTHQADLQRLGFGMVGYVQAHQDDTPHGLILREDGDLDPLDPAAVYQHFQGGEDKEGTPDDEHPVGPDEKGTTP
jgi:thiamine monophosphate kinase